MRRFTCLGLYTIHIIIYNIYIWMCRTQKLVSIHVLFLFLFSCMSLYHIHTHTSARAHNHYFSLSQLLWPRFCRVTPKRTRRVPVRHSTATTDKGKKNMEQEYSNMWVTHIISVYIEYTLCTFYILW